MEITSQPLEKNIKRDNLGKIKIKSKSTSQIFIKLTLGTLFILTVLGFLTFDYKGINLLKAVKETLTNVKIMFFEASLTHFTFLEALKQIGVTLSLAFLTTLIGAFIALFLGLFAAKNLSNNIVSNIIKGFVAFIRAVPTVLWVLIFAVSAGLGSVAAVIGLTFHSFAYLTKVYAESIEEIDDGTIEALRASGAGFWQIVFQAIVPASLSRMVAWTFMRFEINFTNAIAVGAAAGAGGIGFNLYMAGSFYFNLHEMGILTYIVVIAVVMLEMFSTKIKERVK